MLDLDSIQHRFDTFRSLMASRVREILLVSSVYDAYILEEDGTLETVPREAGQEAGVIDVRVGEHHGRQRAGFDPVTSLPASHQRDAVRAVPPRGRHI